MMVNDPVSICPKMFSVIKPEMMRNQTVEKLSAGLGRKGLPVN
jgi:hypothetical protein